MATSIQDILAMRQDKKPIIVVAQIVEVGEPVIKSGKKTYTNYTIRDLTGTIYAKLWSHPQEGIEADDWVKINGKLNVWHKSGYDNPLITINIKEMKLVKEVDIHPKKLKKESIAIIHKEPTMEEEFPTDSDIDPVFKPQPVTKPKKKGNTIIVPDNYLMTPYDGARVAALVYEVIGVLQKHLKHWEKKGK